jgi:hypothetical protein
VTVSKGGDVKPREPWVELGARLTANLRALSVARMEQYNFDTLREEKGGRGVVQKVSTTKLQDTHHGR